MTPWIAASQASLRTGCGKKQKKNWTWNNRLFPHWEKSMSRLARSKHTRSHPWEGREEKTWQARQIRTSGILKSCPSTHLKDDICLLMLAILDYFLISLTQVEGLPRSHSKQNQLRTLINTSPRWWYPIRLSRMKGVFWFRPLCWHSSLLGKCILMHMTAHIILIINSIKNLITQKALIGTEPFGGWGSPIREHKNIILKVVIVKDLEK